MCPEKFFRSILVFLLSSTPYLRMEAWLGTLNVRRGLDTNFSLSFHYGYGGP